MGNTHAPRARIPGGARRRALRIGLPLAVLAVAIATGSAQADGAAPGTVSNALAAVGSIAAAPAGAKAAAEPSDSTAINVDIALQPRNAAELATYAELVSDPNSLSYKQYLTKEQTQLLFAPSQSEVDGVRTALTAAGLNPGSAIDDNLYIPVAATVGQLKQAFKIGFAGYELTDGQLAFNATSVPKISGSVADEVKGIIGLDDFVKPNDDYQTAGKRGQKAAVSAAMIASKTAATHNNSVIPTMCPSLTSTTDSYLAQYGYVGKDGGTYYSPTAMASAYGYAGLLESGTEGQGVTVAVEEWEAPDRQAIADYENCVGSQSKVSYVSDNAGTPAQPTPTNLVGVETGIDIESVASVAPKASIIDYEGPDDSASFTDADWLDTFAAPVAADSAKAISLSWLSCETGPIDTTLEDGQTTTLQLAAVQGQSFFTASGDNGSEGCAEPEPSVSDAANNPWITAVGGTYMQGLTNPTVTPWNDSFDTSATSGLGLINDGGASGGGVSTLQSFTSDWNYQAGFLAPGYSNVCGVSTGGACRQVPDLSALGDWRSGFPVVYYADGSGYDILMVAGTSLASPITAAMTALADSSDRCALNGPAGFINPTIYNLAKNPTTYAANFQDETTGNNAYTPSGYTGSLYQATTGYDMASGLGSPKARNFIPSLCASNTWTGGWSFGHSPLGLAPEHGQASIDKTITIEAAEERSH
ncbi:MAG TPA: S53 family peptidase [Pseudonocardiaceae bacterium]|jgi:subtilase family serine protease|nr:S53 family peptidase [Pseudonocardiaceae bacterium]